MCLLLKIVNIVKKIIFYIKIKLIYGSKISFDLRNFNGKVSVYMESKSEFMILKKAFISDYVNIKCYRDSNLYIGENTFIGPFSIIHCRKNVKIGNNCMIGEFVSIRDNDHEFRDKNRNYNEQGFKVKETIIGDNVWIGAKVTILSGVTIGNNSIIGANTLVNKDIPDNTIVGGVPGKVIKKI